MVLTSIVRQAVTKRVPSIKFRKGGPVMSAAAGGSHSQTLGAPGVSSTTTSPPPAARGTANVVIEDWELPPRYRRKPIDSVEMEYINRGGPA